MEPMKWELYDQFIEQQKLKREQNEQNRKSADEAWERLQEADQKHQQIIFREFQGEDVSKDKEEAKGKVDEARESFEAALEKRRPSRDNNETDKITSKELIKDWNDNVLPKIKEQQLETIKKKMEKSRYNYYHALKNYYALNDKYRSMTDEIIGLEFIRAQRSGDFTEMGRFDQRNELPFIRREHLEYIAFERQLPKEIEKES
jgi:leucyl aminopeptidase (aminopeptidase T)